MNNPAIVEIVICSIALCLLIFLLWFTINFRSRMRRRKRVDTFLSGAEYKDDLFQMNLQNRSEQIMENMRERDMRKKYEKAFMGKLQPMLNRSGIKIMLPKFVFICIGIGMTLFVIASFIGLPPLVRMGLFFMGTIGLPIWYLKRRIKKRQETFIKEFPNALELLIRGVSSGMSEQNCFRQIAREIPGPCGEEFGGIMNDVQNSVPLAQAIYNSYDRIQVPEVKFFACVISIQQQSGGSLSEIVNNIVDVMRGRVFLKGKADALASEAKAQSLVLGALPFVIVGLISWMDYAYVSILWTTSSGKTVLTCSILMMAVGVFVMQKIGQIDM